MSERLDDLHTTAFTLTELMVQEENAHLLISIEAVKPADLSLAADDPCGAFPELDLSYETIEAITHSSWESKINALAHSLTEDEY